VLAIDGELGRLIDSFVFAFNPRAELVVLCGGFFEVEGGAEEIGLCFFRLSSHEVI
jgi:hypothetical protein